MPEYKIRELENLQKRMHTVVTTVCNVVGCDKCSLKWESDCVASDLQGKIMDIEMGE